VNVGDTESNRSNNSDFTDYCGTYSK